MKKQKILFPIYGDNETDQGVTGHYLKLPKIITNVSTFEMQFGMRQPTLNNNHSEGIKSRTIPYGNK